MNLVRAFFFWLYLAVVFVSGGAVLVVSASGVISELRHLRACSVSSKTSNECRLS